MKQLNIRNYLRHFMAVALAGIMAASLSATAFAAELCPICGIPDCTCCTTGSGSPNWSGTVATVTGFSDVPSTHTFYTGIMWCAERGIVGGYADGTFKPTNTVTRANFTVMLTRAFYANEIDSSYVNPDEGSFAPNYLVAKLHNMLAYTNFNYTTLKPAVMNQGINRYDMAQLMTNIMTENGFSASAAEKSAAIAKITDYNSITSDRYNDSVANVYALGIIGGYADGSFGGNVTMNRGQAAIVIYRMMQKMYPDGEVGTPDPEVPTDPNTGEMACSCIQLTGECKCCNTTSSGTGTTTPVVPDKPSNVTGKTLVDGSAVTEANVMRLMEARRAEWGNKYWDGEDGQGYSYPQGNNGDVKKIVSTYRNNQTNAYNTSCSGGCGGWATYLSDAAFGNTGFPLRKVTNPDDVRAGDIVIYLRDGLLRHITVASGKDNIRDFGSYTVTCHGEYTANTGTIPGENPNGIDMSKPIFTTNYDSTTGESRVIYTRYPD